VNKFSWDHEDHLILGSIANDPGDPGPPGTAKNALGVSAAQKTDPLKYGQGLAGPFEKLRKPDLTAVGCGVESALRDPMDHCKTGPYQSRVSCSTSDATAHAAAIATPARQYYTEGRYPSGTAKAGDAFKPSGALLKATLLNSTRDMTGVAGFPSDTEGWGVITLDRTLFFPGGPRDLRVWDVRNASDDSLVTTYQPGVLNGDEYKIVLGGSSEPLRVTLVWR